ncbi:MAG TPA: hypothetical protein VFK89_10885, partial [Actinomycetota bacterium]|nr:hypothetical protein [Actinomycetota bacterium]
MIAALGGRGVSELESGTIVVLPSLTFPPEELRKILGIQFYEERLLCMLLLLDRTDLDIVYVTSTPIDPAVVDYYLSFLKDPESARERLHLVALEDPRPVALSAKVFDHRDGVDLIRRAVVRRPAYLFPFNVTGAEERISEAAGLPLYGPDPRLAALGTKSGAREVAIDAGVPVPVGAGDLYSVEELDRAVGDILRKSPSVRRVVVKLNNGFSGQGNAIVDVSGNDGTITERPTDFCAEEESWPTFVAKVEREGAVVEELLDAPGTVSPSV